LAAHNEIDLFLRLLKLHSMFARTCRTLFCQFQILSTLEKFLCVTISVHSMDSLILFWKKLIINISESLFNKDFPSEVYVHTVEVVVYYIGKTRIEFEFFLF